MRDHFKREEYNEESREAGKPRTLRATTLAQFIWDRRRPLWGKVGKVLQYKCPGSPSLRVGLHRFSSNTTNLINNLADYLSKT